MIHEHIFCFFLIHEHIFHQKKLTLRPVSQKGTLGGGSTLLISVGGHSRNTVGALGFEERPRSPK